MHSAIKTTTIFDDCAVWLQSERDSESYLKTMKSTEPETIRIQIRIFVAQLSLDYVCDAQRDRSNDWYHYNIVLKDEDDLN